MSPEDEQEIAEVFMRTKRWPFRTAWPELLKAIRRAAQHDALIWDRMHEDLLRAIRATP